MNLPDLYWLAGLLEGEGCFYLNKRPNVYIRIDLRMTDADIVYRAATIMGVHRVFTIAPRELNGRPRKLQYGLTMGSRRAAAWMMTLWPLMGARRQRKIRATLEAWKGMEKRKQRRLFHRKTSCCPRGHRLDVLQGPQRCPTCRKIARIVRLRRNHRAMFGRS